MKYYKRKHYKRLKIIRRRRSILRNRFLWISLAIFTLFISISYFLFFSPYFQIKNIRVKSLSKDYPELDQQIRLIVDQKKETKSRLFKSDSIFLLRSSKIENYILKTMPQIETINISKKIPNSIVVVYKKREEVAVWHQVDGLDQYFLIDKNAIIFQKVSSSTKGVVIETNAKFDKLGQKILDEKYLEAILDAKDKIEQITKEKIQKIIVRSPTYLSIKMNEGWSIYLNPQNNIDWQLTELNSVLENVIPQDKIGKLKYIDLRFNKVFISPTFH